MDNKSEYSKILKYLDGVKKIEKPHEIKIDKSHGDILLIENLDLTDESIKSTISKNLIIPSYFFVDEIVGCIRKSYFLRKDNKYLFNFWYFDILRRGVDNIGLNVGSIISPKSKFNNYEIKSDRYNLYGHINCIYNESLIFLCVGSSSSDKYKEEDYYSASIYFDILKVDYNFDFISDIILIYLLDDIQDLKIFKFGFDKGVCEIYIKQSGYLKKCLENDESPKVSMSESCKNCCIFYDKCSKLEDKKSKKKEPVFLM